MRQCRISSGGFPPRWSKRQPVRIVRGFCVAVALSAACAALGAESARQRGAPNEKQIEELVRRADAAEARWREADGHLQAAIKELRSVESEQARTQVLRDRLKKEIGELEGKRKPLADAATKAGQMLQAARKKADAEAKRRADIEKSLQSLQAQLAALRKEQAELSRRLEQKPAPNKGEDFPKEETNAGKDRDGGNPPAAEPSKEAAQGGRTAATDSGVPARADADSSAKKPEKKDDPKSPPPASTRENLKKRLAVLAQRIAELQKQVDVQSKALQSATAAAQTAEKELKAARQAAQKAQAQLAQVEQAIAAKRAQLEKAEEQLALLGQKQAALKQRVEQLRPEVEKLRAEFLAARRAADRALIAAGKLVSFAESVAPILVKRCLACHNARTAKGRLNLETFAALMAGGESGAVVEPGDPDASVLVAMVEDGSMPKDADPLTPEQIAIIRKWVATGARLDVGIDPHAKLFNIAPKEPQPAPPDVYPVPVAVTALAFSPDGKWLASSGYHEVILWDAQSGRRVRRITNIAERVHAVAFSPDGKMLAVAAGTPGQMGELKLFNPHDGTLLADLVTTADSMLAAAFDGAGERVACAGADRSVFVFDVAQKRKLLEIQDHADWVMAVAWSPDGKKLVTAARDKTCKVFDATSGEALVTFNGHTDAVYAAAFAFDGKSVVSAGRDKQLRVWDPANGKQIRAIGGFGGEVFMLAISPDSHVFSACEDKQVREHEIGSGKAVRSYTGHKDWVFSVAVHPGSKRLAGGGIDGEIVIWNTADGKVVLRFVAAPGLNALERSDEQPKERKAE